MYIKYIFRQRFVLIRITMQQNKPNTIDEKVGRRNEIDSTITGLLNINPADMNEAQKAKLAEWLTSAALQNPDFSKKVLSQGNIYDSLTGSYNRNFLETKGKQAATDYAKSGNPLSVLYVDIDHFKTFNDTYGHAAGDYVLSETAKTLEDNIRTKDMIGFEPRRHDISLKPFRYGGEEFVVLIGAEIHDAENTAERLRYAVQQHDYHLPENIKLEDDKLSRDIRVNVSVGVTDFNHAQENIEGAMQRADKAMYHSKNNGRNRTTSIPFKMPGYSLAA
jgi:diguanylate cyclase (GGDEF)-like protein